MIQAIKNWEELGHTPLSYSSIKSFREGGIGKYWAHKEGKLEPKSTPSLTLGTLIDEYILNKNEFGKKYLLQTAQPPASENQKMFAIDVASGNYSIEEAYKRNYKNAPKTESKLTEKAEALFEELKDWIEFLPGIGGKELYSEDDSYALSQISMNMMGHKVFRDVYSAIQGDLNSDVIEVRTHVSLTGSIYGFPARGELDLVVINHDRKTVEVYDLKSTYVALNNFHYEVRSNKYPLQHVMYQSLVKEIPEVKNQGYGVLFPKFVVCRTNGNFDVGVFKLPEAWILQEVREVKRDIETIAWHYENRKFKYPKKYYEGSGIIELDFLEDLEVWKANVEQQLS